MNVKESSGCMHGSAFCTEFTVLDHESCFNPWLFRNLADMMMQPTVAPDIIYQGLKSKWEMDVTLNVDKG